ncbi:uncharacterized protein V1510DRAFT_411765 [Dipodascopsis tothii]|uniref:uncharacterized protein n=1 Tax=Dipodascopsis tothii TaxID=44089 RepID=UPI0034CFEC38
MQWTGRERFLERVVYDGGRGPTQAEIRERVAVAKRTSTRVWELKYDAHKISAEVVVASAVVSILDQWSTVWGVGGVFFNKPSKPVVHFAT